MFGVFLSPARAGVCGVVVVRRVCEAGGVAALQCGGKRQRDTVFAGGTKLQLPGRGIRENHARFFAKARFQGGVAAALCHRTCIFALPAGRGTGREGRFGGCRIWRNILT